MATSPYLPLEIVEMVLDNVETVKCLINCACVNSVWNMLALKRLYRGSIVDMKFRTPDIKSLNSLFTISREHFARNMSFVEHLLLSPNQFGRIGEEQRRVCLENCLAMSHGQSLGQGNGLTSLIIPCEVIGQDLSITSDLLCSPTIQFLAIDSSYCKILMSNLGVPPIGRQFSNIRALAIYRSSRHHPIKDFWELIRCCNLQLFRLQDVNTNGWSNSSADIAKLLRCLEQQQNLQALALDLHMVQRVELPRKECELLWARLKALQLSLGFLHWRPQFPAFENLQILILFNYELPSYEISDDEIRQLSRYRRLRCFILRCGLHDPAVLLDIAHGCPLLQRLEVSGAPDLELKEGVFTGILSVLPYLEILCLHFHFHMNGALLKDIAQQCPQLIVLDMAATLLYLSLPLLQKFSPLTQLKVMRFSNIFFKNPQRLWYQNKVPSIVAEWRRKFPNLRQRPIRRQLDYPSEGSCTVISSQNCSSEELARMDNESDDEEMLCGPRFDRKNFFEYDPLEDKLLWTVWNLLEYKEYAMVTRLESLWQANLETEILGWPMVPLEAILFPEDG